MDPIMIASLVSLLLLIIPGVLLIMQFRYSKIKIYLLFSLFFWMNIFATLLVLISGVNEPYNVSMSEFFYLFSYILILLLDVFGWFIFFYLGYKSIWPNGNKLIFYIYAAISLAYTILISTLKLQIVPESSKIFGITIMSSFTGVGAVIEIFPRFYFGQGYLMLLDFWNLACLFIFLLSFVKMQNKISYPGFRKVRAAWLIFIISYTFSVFLILVTYFFDIVSIVMIAQLSQFIGILGIIYVSIAYPEGLLLDRIQLLKAVKLIDSIEPTEHPFPGVRLENVMNYIDFVHQNFDPNTSNYE